MNCTRNVLLRTLRRPLWGAPSPPTPSVPCSSTVVAPTAGQRLRRRGSRGPGRRPPPPGARCPPWISRSWGGKTSWSCSSSSSAWPSSPWQPWSGPYHCWRPVGGFVYHVVGRFWPKRRTVISEQRCRCGAGRGGVIIYFADRTASFWAWGSTHVFFTLCFTSFFLFA